MKGHFFHYLIALIIPVSAGIENPISDFKNGLIIPPKDKILKWNCDINGDGEDEMLLAIKSDVDKDAKNHQPPGWAFYIDIKSENGYVLSKGTEEREGTLSVDDIPTIDPAACFVGKIDELGKTGIITMREDNLRNGESIGKIYVYIIEGDHLKFKELTKFDLTKEPPTLFKKYLVDGKRTIVHLTEIDP